MAGPLPASSQGVSLPELVTNPAASLRPATIEVFAAGKWIIIPALNAAQWLELLMEVLEDEDLDCVFPGLASDDDYDRINEALIAGDLTVSQLQDLALAVITEASGRPWWVTMRLTYIAVSRWGLLGGKLALAQINPVNVALGAWLDAMWLTLFDSLPRDKWTMMASTLEMPPPQEAAAHTIDSMEMSVNQFTSLMAG